MLLLLLNQPAVVLSPIPGPPVAQIVTPPAPIETGDSVDILGRVKQLIPGRWFAWVAPYRDAVLGGLADGAAAGYNFYLYAKAQSRIATATGPFLDLIGWDFFGARFTRRFGETDSSWRPRILLEILRPRQTRAAITQMLTDLTGQAPQIFEAFNTGDEGSYSTGTMAYGFGLGYGSLAYPNQIFVTAFRVPSQGVPLVSGYGDTGGGYGVGLFGYIDTSLITGAITDAEIAARVSQTVAAGITAWLTIEDPPGIAASAAPSLDYSVGGDSQYLPLM